MKRTNPEYFDRWNMFAEQTPELLQFNKPPKPCIPFWRQSEVISQLYGALLQLYKAPTGPFEPARNIALTKAAQLLDELRPH